MVLRKRVQDSDLDVARQRMLDVDIRGRGISDARVLTAMGQVPRELFVSVHPPEMAYADRALAIEHDQTISQPFIVAYMTAQLDLQPTHTTLEIGTGSGYQTAVLSQLCQRVHSIERIPELSRLAQHRLTQLGYTQVTYHVDDGTLGLPDLGPFERILVGAAAPSVPSPLVEQLADDGRMIIPVGDAHQQRLLCITKKHDRVIERPLIAVRFVKLYGQFSWQPSEHEPS